MIRRPIATATAVWLSVASLVVVLLAYTGLAEHQKRINSTDTTVPNWGQLAAGMRQMVTPHPRTGERWLVDDLRATRGRFLLGLATGVSVGVSLGLLMGIFPAAEAIFHPPLAFLAQVPPTAALAVYFVLAGTGTEMFVAMIAIGILPALAMSVFLAVREFPEELQYKAYTLGASHGEVVWNILLRHSLPRVLDAVRLAVGPALVYLIAAEMVVGDVGFGYRIRLQSKLLNMNVVYPYLALLAAGGFTADWTLRRLRRRLCPWAEGGTQ